MKKITFYLFTLLCLSLSLVNCDKEEIIFEENNDTLNTLQKSFDKESFSKILPYDFKIDWNNLKKNHSNELKSDYYEFPIIYTNSFNPNRLYELGKDKRRKTTYKLIIVENKSGDYDSYLGKFIQEKGTNLIENKNIFFGDTSIFSGYIHLFDEENDLVYAKKLKNGVNVLNNILLKKKFKNFSNEKRVGMDCQSVPVFHYKDWYKVWDDTDGHHSVYLGSQFLGVTYVEECTEGFFPELGSGTNGGAGSGTYRGNGNNGSYENCNDCLLEIEDEEIAVPYPHCSSFEYANQKGVKVASMSGMSHTFYTARMGRNGVYYAHIDIDFPTLYFTCPSNWTNGRSATLTAQAVNRALDITRTYWANNPNVAEVVISQLIYTNIKTQMKAIGGNMSTINLYNITTKPAPYKSNLLTTGNCG